MLKNYFKIAWRNLCKHKLFSFINIFGLASGMTVCMMAIIKIKDAYDYDTFHPNIARTYRIITNLNKKNGDHFLYASSPLPLAGYLKNNYDAIEKSTSVLFSHDEVAANNKNLFVKEAYVNADFFKIFGFKLSAGSPATEPQTVVLTDETAKLFFGNKNPIGQRIRIGKSNDFLVTGVLTTSLPSHLKFDVLANISNPGPDVNWNNESAAYTYVQLKKNETPRSLSNILKNASAQANLITNPALGKNLVFESQPLSKISPGSKPMYNITNEPILPNLISFGMIGFAMLLLAFFNYVNLTLARSLDRAREVGIRKVAGAIKRQLIQQFLSESILAAIFAFCLAYLQLKLISKQPTVQRLIGGVTEDKTLWLYFFVFTIVTGLVAGWIPARIFSSFQPVQVLKGKFNTKLFGGVGLRKALTVTQFAASLIAIITLAVFYRQSIYMVTADYGFKKEGILNIQFQQHSYEKAAASFSALPGVENVSGTSEMFGLSGGELKFIRKDKVSDSIRAAYFSASPSFLKNMGVQLVAGTDFPDAISEKGSRRAIINEEAVRALQFKNSYDAIEKSFWNEGKNYIIAGVVKDFHHASFLQPVQPVFLVNNPEEFKTLNLKVAKGAEKTMVASAKSAWRKIFPNQPFEAAWFDDQLYERHMNKDDLVFMGLLTAMALCIACLGRLGMVIYTTKNRAKEVSIRRVMGAKAVQVIVTISKEFIALLLLAVCIGLPIGFFAGNQFLQQYAYRITVGFGTLAVSAGALFLLGALTIGWQVYRTALANPVKNLRTE
jgi:putative ABC transport system permease protein